MEFFFDDGKLVHEYWEVHKYDGNKLLNGVCPRETTKRSLQHLRRVKFVLFMNSRLRRARGFQWVA